MARPVTVTNERLRQALEMTRWRKENLLSQTQMAKALGVSRRCVQGVESARHTPHPATYKLFVQLRERYKRRAQAFRDAPYKSLVRKKTKAGMAERSENVLS